jgi:hypothetical protein
MALGHEQVAGLEVAADLVHAGDQPAGEDLLGLHSLVQCLLDQLGDCLVLAVVQVRCDFL